MHAGRAQAGIRIPGAADRQTRRPVGAAADCSGGRAVGLQAARVPAELPGAGTPVQPVWYV